MDHAIAQNKSVYNAIAKHFSETRTWMTDDLVPFLPYVQSGDQILDIACGNARLYQLFVQHSRQEDITYTGVDFSEELLAMARERFPDIDVRVGEMQQLPFDDTSFDLIFCLAAFHHLAKKESRIQALHEVVRVLKPGGRYIMTNWNLYSDWAKGKLDEGKWKIGQSPTEHIVPWKNQDGDVIGERLYYAYTLEELEAWCIEAGLHVEKQYYAAKKASKEVGGGMNIVTIATKPQ